MRDRILKLEQNFLTSIYIIICLLVFEGLLRKILPTFVGNLIFFLKDIMCFILLIFYLKNRFPRKDGIKKFNFIWTLLFLFFIPIFVVHAFYDPILVFWGGKLYLLYPIIAICLYLGFESNPAKIMHLVLFVSFLIIPTGIVALIQNSLPASHWLNTSVGGDSLERFSAAGFLRVSSTFSFTGQYSFFLVFASAFYFGSFYVIKSARKSFYNNWFIRVLTGFLLILSVFVTGGRTAVFGAGLVLLGGILLQFLKFPSKTFQANLIPIITLVVALTILPILFPDFFAAYQRRSEGGEDESNVKEVTGRVFGSYLNGLDIIANESIDKTVFGNGIGVMTNGSDKISSYAAGVRSQLWTENDFSTVSWEGGVYLIFLWYAFRLGVIFLCYKIFLKTEDRLYSCIISFLLAYIIIIGLTGTLSIQPPLAIWWYISIGTILIINKLNREKLINSNE
ncbi:hypothetical protein [Zunongwangia profunda]|mgnify:CR=1 FL=1|uniref:hypothetical protein n=2 Tax=Zunongwangia profunda TaxID=398743 RepID=UPI00248E8494|nr:hypothetical protein [Zunongwangia profunda]|tara:strand:- start:5264 stop:6616 length:1353 start_codon:yes stop_codon:yes gene_type:complete